MAVKLLFIGAVPTTSGIEIAIASATFTVLNSFFQASAIFNAVRRRLNGKVCAIANGSNVVGLNQAKLYGRDNGGQDKDFMKEFLKTFSKGADS